MDASTRELVRRRAGDRCEYCRMPQAATPFIPFHLEHIIAKQHVDLVRDDLGNLRSYAWKMGVGWLTAPKNVDAWMAEFLPSWVPEK